MAYSRFFSARTFTIATFLSFGVGYSLVKSRTLAEKQRERAAGDYSVTVDRSGGGI